MARAGFGPAWGWLEQPVLWLEDWARAAEKISSDP
jgi:hypothetical protein